MTQVGPRPVEAGLGGQDDGVWGVYDGVENTSLPLWKRGRTGCLFVRPSVVLRVFRIKMTVRVRTARRDVVDNDTVSPILLSVSPEILSLCLILMSCLNLLPYSFSSNTILFAQRPVVVLFLRLVPL